MNHLPAQRITAFVDGQLDPVAAEDACTHAAACRECRAALEAERLMKAALVMVAIGIVIIAMRE